MIPQAPPVPVPPMKASEVTALLDQVTMLQPMGPYTVSTLPTPSPALLGRTATVTDLFGGRYSRVRCEKIGTFHFWQPLSSDSFGNLTVGTQTLNPLTVPQTLRVTGNLVANMTAVITLGTTGGWPGAVKEFTNSSSMGTLSAVNIVGTGLGSAVALLLGGYRKFGLDYVGGVLTWVQLV